MTWGNLVVIIMLLLYCFFFLAELSSLGQSDNVFYENVLSLGMIVCSLAWFSFLANLSLWCDEKLDNYKSQPSRENSAVFNRKQYNELLKYYRELYVKNRELYNKYRQLYEADRKSYYKVIDRKIRKILRAQHFKPLL